MSKPISARDSHTVGDTHDHKEITATDVTQPDGSIKRGLDLQILSSVGLPLHDDVQRTTPSDTVVVWTYELNSVTKLVTTLTYNNVDHDILTGFTKVYS